MKPVTQTPILTIIALSLALIGCGGGGSGGGSAGGSTTPLATNGTPPVTTINPNVSSTPVWQIPVFPSQASSQAAAQNNSPVPNLAQQQTTSAANNGPLLGSVGSNGTNNTNQGTTGSGTTGSGTTGSGTTGSGTTGSGTTGSVNNPVPAATIAPELYGSIPPAPETGFNGTLFFVGSQIALGSQIQVSFNGTPIKFLNTTYVSSELLSAYVYLTIPGDYKFEAVAPDGSVSQGFEINVPLGNTFPAFTGQSPDVQMIYPPAMNQGFIGTVWIMGDNFMQGSSIVMTGANGFPVTIPVTFVNSKILQWNTAFPLQGSLDIKVVNPDFSESQSLTLTVSAPSLATSNNSFPAPRILGMAGGVLAPFFGSVRVYGQDLMPGAVMEMKNIVTGQTTSSPLAFVSNNEMIWSLAYPQFGSYECRVINPDGQATPVQFFDVN